MKKFTLPLLTVFLGLNLFFSACKTEKQSDIPALLDTAKLGGTEAENANIKSTYNNSIAELNKNPDNLKPYINLATVFILEGRISGNNNYYANAAVKMLDKVLDSHTGNKDLMFQAYSLKSTVELNMHQFKDALETAKKGEAISQYSASIYGDLVDANVELGNYDQAVKDCDKMIGIRPDLRSYSRGSYIRQIYGLNGPAIAAMRMAVEAGEPGSESTEWARVILGDLYMNTGKLDTAKMLYTISLQYRPNYPYAEMGLARVATAEKNYDEAMMHTKNAIRTMSEAAFVSYLGELYELKGNADSAKQVYSDVIDLMEKSQNDEAKDALIKHNVNREMAMAYMNAGQLDKAEDYAKKDLAMRPDNIDANNVMAWILFLKKDYAGAKPYADKMMHTNVKNATTLYEAGAIYAAAGDASKGAEYKQLSQSVSPYVDQRVVNQSKGF